MRRVDFRVGYIQLADEERVALHTNEITASMYEGVGCSLGLLHAVNVDGSRTKYQAMLQDDITFGAYRRSLFDNTEVNRLRNVPEFADALGGGGTCQRHI